MAQDYMDGKKMEEESLIEKLVHSSNIYEGKLFNLRRDTVKLPNGRLTERHIVEHRGAVAIIPIIGEKIVLIRQFRQAAGKILYEIPAGTLEKGDEPDKCAVRELREETGYVGNLTRLFHCYLAPGYSTEIIHFYSATNLKKVEHETDPDEFIEIVTISKIDAARMIVSNEIEDAKTICGILIIQRLDKVLLL